MPTAKLSVADFLDHGVVAATPVATRVFEEDAIAIAPAKPAPAETMTMVMTASKQFTATAIKKDALAGLILAAQTPIQLAATLIKARYDLLGGSGGFLGAAQGAVTVCPDGEGYFQHYAGGSIYWSPSTGAHEVHGLIRQKWANMGWERSFLGYPRTDEKKGRDQKQEGRFSVFQGGTVFYHPASGTFEVHGAILEKYEQLGAEASLLGYPTTDETGTPDARGRFNHFQRGSIYFTPQTWAHEVHGLIRSYWAENGWERNAALGYPLTDELVPHRGVGHTSAPIILKPIDLPFDILKLPVTEPSPTLKPIATTTVATVATTKAATTTKTTTTTTKATTAAKTTTAAKAATATASKSSAASAAATPTVASTVSIVKLGSTADLVAVPSVIKDPVIFINDHKGRSDDRFCDFENGVLFWQRRTNKVSLISPRAKSPQGTKVAFTAAEIATLVGARVKAFLGTFPGGTVGTSSCVGTMNYTFDGAGLHNRAHRIRVNITGKKKSTGAATTSTVEVRAEISFDPVDREIVGYISSWYLPVHGGDFQGGGTLLTDLRVRLDPAVWKQFSITKVPATADNPIAILSVKTLTDGRVATYFEP